jgi:hypothetical protein
MRKNIMIKVNSRDHHGLEVLINENNMLYAVPSLNGETIVYFDKVNFLVLTENYDDFKKRFDPPKEVTVPRTLLTESVTGGDGYDDLPKLPNGNIDKRTVQYKEWKQSI